MEYIILLLMAVLGLGTFALIKVRKKSVTVVGKSEKKALSTVRPLPLSGQLERTHGLLGGKLKPFWNKGRLFKREEWRTIEEILLEGDVGVSTVGLLLEIVRKDLEDSGSSLNDSLHRACLGLFQNQCSPLFQPGAGPRVISIVGVNGVGKTTTIGKIACLFRVRGLSVLLGAGDTFRAAAISQLKVWAERAGAEFVTGREGADPGAVAFDAVSAAKARGIDVALLDSAGRLHTKSNLMEELKKTHRVIKKVIPEAPHEVWIVLDGTTGQNSVNQAREFQRALSLTGVIVTKLDGTAKGGALLGIVSELKLPVHFIGVGESVEDLLPFDPKSYVEAILGKEH